MKQKTHADTEQSNRRNSLSKKKFSSRFKSAEEVFSLPQTGDDIKKRRRERERRTGGKVEILTFLSKRARVCLKRERMGENGRGTITTNLWFCGWRASERRTNAKKGGGWREKTKKKEREFVEREKGVKTSFLLVPRNKKGKSLHTLSKIHARYLLQLQLARYHTHTHTHVCYKYLSLYR